MCGRPGRRSSDNVVLIALGNGGDSDSAPAAEARLAGGSPLVRAMAVRALSRLLSRERFAALRTRHAPSENDADVGAEWRRAQAAAPVATI